MELLEMIKAYQALLEKKEELEEQTKANNEAIKNSVNQITTQMVKDDCPRVSVGGYSYSLQNKVNYSKKSEEELQKNGLDFLAVLRAEGLGDIIKETVNAQTLGSTMKAYVEEHDELSEALASVINVYEFSAILRRKDSGKKARGI